MGQNHARVLSQMDGVTLKAVVDVNKTQADNVGARYHAASYTDYTEMLAKEDVDAVTIAVPTTYHHACAIYLLNLKKHVLLEKPIASTQSEARDIIDVAQRNGVTLMIGHIERFNPAIVELKKRLEAGELGDIYKIDVQRIGPFPHRITDVGVIVDLSVHDIDVINYLMGKQVRRVYAEIQQRLHPHSEDSVTALLRYENDVLGILNINYLSPKKIRQISVFGKKGMFRANYLSQELFFYENKSFDHDDWSSVSEGDMRKITLAKKEPLYNELDHFVRVVQGKEKPCINGEDGYHALMVAHHILRSAQEQAVVLVNT